jgi:hypothetical protein
MMSLPAIELCALLVQDSQPFSVRQTNGTIAEAQEMLRTIQLADAAASDWARGWGRAAELAAHRHGQDRIALGATRRWPFNAGDTPRGGL